MVKRTKCKDCGHITDWHSGYGCNKSMKKGIAIFVCMCRKEKVRI